MKLAFASEDGVNVSQHFGHSTRFRIIELDETDYSLIDLPVREYHGEDGVSTSCAQGNRDHDTLRERVVLLSDVNVLFVVKVGGFGYNLLSNAGIQVLEQAGPIDHLIEGYVRYLKRPKFAGLKTE
jgi:predicted Fe-Mo cluster-binding NifX family protein